ncbi:hypothetical protein E1263_02790 [Kribbella antibiotica]|uniref:Uncharacterized protein n=1 Tax=Kribbella antibiotica TaxID=190195 RepID=A0A4R4ZU53_9ACTN|nr:hypothetical protein [Kribbella antibiotica]TDD62661.1 hypothetical protein E1263_02790 [Kribbella antibiotica]
MTEPQLTSLPDAVVDGQRLLERFGRTADGRPRRMSPIEAFVLAATRTSLVRRDANGALLVPAQTDAGLVLTRRRRW